MDGLCFSPVNGVVELIIAWLSDVWGEKKRKDIKDIKPPAVRERTRSASGPYIKAFHFNHYYSSISLFASPELPLS